MKIEKIAKICHEMNRAYCNCLGDFSHVKWEDAPQWQRDSAVAGVVCKIENPTTTPRQSHEDWLKIKEREGWKYGLTKDIEKKEHPCFLPYDELPAEQKAKDWIFTAVVETLSKF